MSNEYWPDYLRRTLNPPHNHPIRIAILGIGNPLYGDDGVGETIAHKLAKQLAGLDFVQVITAGTSPENCTGQLRKFGPNLTLLIDAAGLNEPAGTIRWLGRDEIDGISASTHTLPLSLLGNYIEIDLNSRVMFLGIQPQTLAYGTPLSTIIAATADEVVEQITALLQHYHLSRGEICRE